MYSDSAGGVGGSESVSLTGLPGDTSVASSVAPRAHFSSERLDDTFSVIHHKTDVPLGFHMKQLLLIPMKQEHL